MFRPLLSLVHAGFPLVVALAAVASARGDEGELPAAVQAIFEKRCLACHNADDRKGDLSLATAAGARAGGESGAAIAPGDADASLMVDYVSGDKPAMPKTGPPLSQDEVAAIRTWIADGAKWPAALVLEDRALADTNWWSLAPLKRPPVPALDAKDTAWVRNSIDAFILAKLREQGLKPSPEADRRTLIRRLYFDLVGLPPPPEEIDRFVADADPRAYENLVERLLASPHYGERWARHWLDVAHYGDTHGYDKDKVRSNAWPYRDWVIRAFNDDKPYDQFVRQQIAGDVLDAASPEGIVATGFLAAGPWDFVGHTELREGTVDKKITRLLDRDDMLATTMNAFVSLTVQCARCHNHKFDPVTQEDYYALQAVFAAVDRADRPFEVAPQIARQRDRLQQQQKELTDERTALQSKVAALSSDALKQVDARIAEVRRRQPKRDPAAFGYHSAIERRQDAAKWVQVDLGRSVELQSIRYVACHDDFAGIGAGFGFPVRYRIEAGDDPRFQSGVTTLLDHTKDDVANPGVTPQECDTKGVKARYVRITATKLAPRQNDYIFALAELSVFDKDGTNLAKGAMVQSLDSIEAPPRWRRSNLVDGYYYGIDSKAAAIVESTESLNQLLAERERVVAGLIDAKLQAQIERNAASLAEVRRKLASLPAPGKVYAASTHLTGGRPRPIRLLHRGDVRSPRQLVGPGAVGCLSELPSRFEPERPSGQAPSAEHSLSDGERRLALANWIVDRRNPLTWRSIVNRIWHYHFGRGLVDTPNDFGRMGSRPTHGELLDHLAAEFRDGPRSLKALHCQIVTSSTYRQASSGNFQNERIDAANRYLWRANRRRLEAESVRDAVLTVAGKLDTKMYGPGFRAFGFKDDHSPHYKYQEHDPDDPATQRRSIYRFIVRSVPDPLMTTLDCADPSQVVEKRNETLTALQALALLNNKLMVRMAEHFAARVQSAGATPTEKLGLAFRLAVGRQPNAEESSVLLVYAQEHGWPNTCRLIFNLNEFVFVD